MLFKPKEGEVLQIDLAVLDHVLSVVLTGEEDNVQKPLYYLSKSLTGSGVRYSILGKLVYSVVMSIIILRPYFESHTICV